MLNSSDKKYPLSVRLMARFGFRHVPDNTLQIIERHGRFHRAVEGPFVRRNLFSESFGSQIRVGVVSASNLIENVISRDGIPHKIRVAAKAFFDIRTADEKIQPIIAKLGTGMIQGKIGALSELALRREVAYLNSTQLLDPDLPTKLEAAIRKQLEGLTRLGANVSTSPDGVVVKEILPPERMQINRTEATNINETIDNFAHQNLFQIKQALLAHLLRDMGDQKPSFKVLNLPDELNPTSDDPVDGSFRVLRQPTGRLLDN